ncbi:MAG: helix-turn-helix transcriptional regulator [Myxococcaceae bacterium]
MTVPKPRETIAANVKRLRSRAGLTQAQLAEAVGVSDETISRIERAAFEPGVMTACGLASALRVTVEDLVRPGARSASAVAVPAPLRILAERARRLDIEGQKALVKIADVLLAAERRSARRNSSSRPV